MATTNKVSPKIAVIQPFHRLNGRTTTAAPRHASASVAQMALRKRMPPMSSGVQRALRFPRGPGQNDPEMVAHIEIFFQRRGKSNFSVAPFPSSMLPF